VEWRPIPAVDPSPRIAPPAVAPFPGGRKADAGKCDPATARELLIPPQTDKMVAES